MPKLIAFFFARDPRRASSALVKAHRKGHLGRMLFVFCVLVVSGQLVFSGSVIYDNPWFFLTASKEVPGVPVHLSFKATNSPLAFGYYGYSASVSNVTFFGRIEVTFLNGAGWVNNYDGHNPLAIRFVTGAKAFGASFSSFLPSPPYSFFPATITTDLGDTIHFTSGATPAFAWMGLISTNSFYTLTYSDGGILNNEYHEELIGDIDLVLNPPPNLEASFGPGGRVDVAVNGSRGQTVVVETSTNLVIWQPLSTNTLANDRWVYSEYRSTVDPKRYYRSSLR
jgi:hypothetical protein